jgi:hypothetical protein
VNVREPAMMSFMVRSFLAEGLKTKTLIGSRALQQLHPGSVGIMGVAHIPLEQPDEIPDPVPAR